MADTAEASPMQHTPPASDDGLAEDVRNAQQKNSTGNGHSPSRRSDYTTTSTTATSNLARRQRREEILLLKKSLPSRTELLRIMDSSPAEGERLGRFCKNIYQRIRELEQQYRDEVKVAEDEKRAEAVRRAEERFAARHAETINRFMDKTLSSEDRLAEIQAERQRQLEERAAMEYVRRVEAEEDRLAVERQRVEALNAKATSWNRAVAAVAQKRLEHKVEVDVKNVAESHKGYAKEQAKRRQQTEHLHELREWSHRIDERAAQHRQRHEQRLRERAAAAAAKANAPVRNPDAPVERHQRYVEIVEKDNARLRESERRVQQQRQELSQLVRDSRDERLQHAQKRLDEQRRREAAKAAAAEHALNVRLHRHAERIDRKRAEQAKRAEAKLEKLARCKSAVQNRDDERHSDLAKKLVDRTLRIGSALGVELPPILPPSTMLTTAAPPPPERPERHPRGGSSAEHELTFQPSVVRKRYKQAPAPARSVSAPPGGAPAAAASSTSNDPARTSTGRLFADDDHDEAEHHRAAGSLLLVIDHLAPPASLLRLAASIVVARMEPSDQLPPPPAAAVASAPNEEEEEPVVAQDPHVGTHERLQSALAVFAAAADDLPGLNLLSQLLL